MYLDFESRQLNAIEELDFTQVTEDDLSNLQTEHMGLLSEAQCRLLLSKQSELSKVSYLIPEIENRLRVLEGLRPQVGEVKRTLKLRSGCLNDERPPHGTKVHVPAYGFMTQLHGLTPPYYLSLNDDVVVKFDKQNQVEGNICLPQWIQNHLNQTNIKINAIGGIPKGRLVTLQVLNRVYDPMQVQAAIHANYPILQAGRTIRANGIDFVVKAVHPDTNVFHAIDTESGILEIIFDAPPAPVAPTVAPVPAPAQPKVKHTTSLFHYCSRERPSGSKIHLPFEMAEAVYQHDSPYLFSLNDRVIATVQDFDQEYGTVCIPEWMEMKINVDLPIKVNLIQGIPKGVQVKLLPLDDSFYTDNQTDVRAALEQVVNRDHTVLQVGQIINTPTCAFEVTVVEPDMDPFHAIYTVDTDLKVEFEPRPIPLPLPTPAPAPNEEKRLEYDDIEVVDRKNRKRKLDAWSKFDDDSGIKLGGGNSDNGPRKKSRLLNLGQQPTAVQKEEQKRQ